MEQENRWNREGQGYERWERGRENRSNGERLRATEDDDDLELDRSYANANRYRGDYFDLKTYREDD